MTFPTKPGIAFSITALLFGTASLSSAQTAPTNVQRDPGEAITLSAFTVQAEGDRGYAASETLTGSRVATKIVDLPYTVNVMTSEFLADFAIFELDDTLTQIGSFTGLNSGGGFTLRGFASTSQLRDGFFRLGRFGASNVDRIEIIKGSNAAIYGRTSPGGMMNMISKQPKSREGYSLGLNVGSYNLLRGSVKATGPVYTGDAGKTSYIFTGTQLSRGYEQAGAASRNTELYLALKHEFRDRSSLFVSAEYFLQTRHSPGAAVPIVTDLKNTASNLDDVAIGYATQLGRFDPYGPHSEFNKGYVNVSGTYEKRFNAIWSARLGANYYRSRSWNYNNNNPFGAISINPQVAAPLTTTRANTPIKQLFIEDGGGFQADLLANYWSFNRTVESRTLVTLDLNDYFRWDPRWSFGAATNPDIVAWNVATSGRVVTLTPDYTPTAALTYFPKDFTWGAEVPGLITKRRISVLGGLLRQQSAFFDGRLLAFAGARVDVVKFHGRDFTTAVSSFNIYPGYANYAQGQDIQRQTTQLKPNVGVNYKLTPALRVFANYSESYFVNQAELPTQLVDPDWKAEVASGYDYGFKGSFLNDRLNFTVSGFYATRQHVTVNDLQETAPGSGTFLTVSRKDGDQWVRGYEIDLNWQLSRSVSLNGSWGHVYSIYTDFGSANPLAIGRRVNGVSPQNGSLSARFAPQIAALKGFSANVGVNFIASTPTEAPNAGDTYTTAANGARILQRTTRQWALRVPSVTLWNVGVRYTLRRSAKFDQTFALNLNNAFDHEYLKATKQLGDGRAVTFSYTLGFSSLRF
jgi:outer membrane receptor protein involved in Fe transport